MYSKILYFFSPQFQQVMNGPIKAEDFAKSLVNSRPHELYTSAMGIYMCWVILRAVNLAVNLFPLTSTAAGK